MDVSAPGGGRKYGVPKFDTRPGTDVLYGGWGELGATIKNGDICRTIGGPADFACFQYDGATFGWFQGTSMSSPQVAGVAALVLAAKPALQEHPDQLAAQLKATARKGIVNHTGKSSASTGAAWDGTPCATGYCHVTFTDVRDGSERDPVHPRLRGGDGRRRGRGQVAGEDGGRGEPRARPLRRGASCPPGSVRAQGPTWGGGVL